MASLAKTHVIVNADGPKAFGGGGEMPTRVVKYNGAYYIVPDWKVNHDSGDEDDGEAKIMEAFVNGTPYNLAPVIIKGLK